MNYFFNFANSFGALAHLARALDWQSKGDRFESDMLHKTVLSKSSEQEVFEIISQKLFCGLDTHTQTLLF